MTVARGTSASASLEQRFRAGVIDIVAYGFVQFVVSLFTKIMFEGGADTWAAPLGLVWVFGTPLAAWSLFAVRHATPGEESAGIRVVRVDGAPLSTGWMMVRTAILLAGILCCFVGPLTIVLSRKRRGLHDLLSGTVVVRRGPTGHCEQCGYDLRGLPEPRCPECGTPFDPEDMVVGG